VPTNAFRAVPSHQTDEESAQHGNPNGERAQVRRALPQIAVIHEREILVVEEVRKEKDQPL
jgi:hypothetical protein